MSVLSRAVLPARDNSRSGGRRGEEAWFRDNECTPLAAVASGNRAPVFDFSVRVNVVSSDWPYLKDSKRWVDHEAAPVRHRAYSNLISPAFWIQT